MVSMPDRVRRLPQWGNLPVPFFVAWFKDGKQVPPHRRGHEGKPDFRVISTDALAMCVRHRRCWICGDRLGALVVFVTGPMSVLQRGSAEPPSHRACAEYAVQVCPFMVDPDAGKSYRATPPGTKTDPTLAGYNPGVVATYVTREWQTHDNPARGVDFLLGPPISISWWRQGRPASRLDVLIGMKGGIQEFLEVAGLDEFDKRFAALEPFLPPPAQKCFT
jgi:hypothetical protein